LVSEVPVPGVIANMYPLVPAGADAEAVDGEAVRTAVAAALDVGNITSARAFGAVPPIAPLTALLVPALRT
jgi:hypothetical protein